MCNIWVINNAPKQIVAYLKNIIYSKLKEKDVNFIFLSMHVQNCYFFTTRKKLLKRFLEKNFSFQIPSNWTNPSGNYHLGVKSIYSLYPSKLKERISASRKKRLWDDGHKSALAVANRALQVRRRLELQSRAIIGARIHKGLFAVTETLTPFGKFCPEGYFCTNRRSITAPLTRIKRQRKNKIVTFALWGFQCWTLNC